MERPQADYAQRIIWAIVAVAFLGALLGLRFSSQADLASSRLASVYSLSQFGTWDIDQPSNRFARETIDKVTVRGTEEDGVMRGGHLISSKPPMIPLLMTGVYYAAHALTGWTLEKEGDISAFLALTTLLFVTMPFALTLVYFQKTLRFFDVPAAPRVFLVASLAFGTQVAGFSATFSNHLPAACAIAVALYFALGLLTEKLEPTAWRFVVFGLLGALAPTLDMPAGIYIAAVGLALLLRFPRQTLLWTVSAGAAPLVIHAWATYAATGHFAPVQTREATYMYESAYWRHPLGIDALSEPKLTYLFHITFGRCGLFSLFPVVFLGIVGVFAAWRTEDAFLKRAVSAGLACFLALTAYYVKSTHNYGGESYGFRWYIASVPVLLLMAAPAVSAIRRRWQWAVVAILLVVSVYSTAECMYIGWESGREWTSRIFGPAYVQVNLGPDAKVSS